MSKVNVDQKSFNAFCSTIARYGSDTDSLLAKVRTANYTFNNGTLRFELAGVVNAKPSRRSQHLRGIANRYGLNQPKVIRLHE